MRYHSVCVVWSQCFTIQQVVFGRNALPCGAVYFRRVEAALRERGSSLQDVLSDYLGCCRRNHGTLEHLTRVLDRLAGSPVFSAELERLRDSKGFPEDMALADRQRPSREQ